MEFQAYRVLVIACDMRQINHIEYTPAPDIVHEAAGHAPIIVDREYADYLQRFGEVGAKGDVIEERLRTLRSDPSPLDSQGAAESRSRRARARDETSRRTPGGSRRSIGDGASFAAALVDGRVRPHRHAREPEDLRRRAALLDRRISELPRTAGEKDPYTIDAQNTAFDITTKQPQLFVTEDFEQLGRVLEQFASRMAFRVGGIEGIQKAIECNNVTTCEYSSGLQVSGRVTEVLTDETRTPIYLRTTEKSALAHREKELPGHGIDYHREGFGSPIGAGKARRKRRASERRRSTGDRSCRGQRGRIEFASGVVVEGTVESILRRDGKLLLISFSDCRVNYGDRVLFEPAWGTFDMAVGERISSVFNGAADKDAFNQVALVPKERTIKSPSDEKRKKLENLYAQVRDIRDRKVGYERLGEIWETQQAEHAHDWLLSMEIFEILDEAGEQNDLKQKLVAFLNQKKTLDKDVATLIEWGFRLVTYHKTGLQIAAH
jgi:phenylalanine-4-hydroxylase